MTISLYLTRPHSKTETSIFARLSFSGFQLKYYTPEKINPKYWNKESQLAKQTDKFKEYPEFNQRLKQWKTEVSNTYRKWINNHQGTVPTPKVLKPFLDKEVKKIETQNDQSKTFLGFFAEVVNSTKIGIRLQPKTGKPYSKATIQVYENTLNRLKAFGERNKRKIDFETINLDFYSDFTSYLTKQLKLASNTVGKDIKTIKTILNEATERGININLQYKSRKFSVTSENTESIYLNENELKELRELDLSMNRRLDNVRDLFLIGCYTGLRYSDYSILRPEQMKEGYIETTQVKTGDAVVIPIHHEVHRILSKYGGHLPKSISNQKTNEYLKDIGKQVSVLNTKASKIYTKGGEKINRTYQKWELLTTHTARRSFATNEYLAGTPTLTIMAITGHRTEKAFLRYIKLTPNEHAKILSIHWQKRQIEKQMRVVV